jgi:hypothetical protein
VHDRPAGHAAHRRSLPCARAAGVGGQHVAGAGARGQAEPARGGRAIDIERCGRVVLADPDATGGPDHELVRSGRGEVRVRRVAPDKGARVVGPGAAAGGKAVVPGGAVASASRHGGLEAAGGVDSASTDCGVTAARAVAGPAADRGLVARDGVVRPTADGSRKSGARDGVAQASADSGVFAAGDVSGSSTANRGR